MAMHGLLKYAPAVLLSMAPLSAAAGQEWQFRVWLDDREIGTHRFEVTGGPGARRIRSTADFEYRMLFLTLYDYEHRNTETWRNGCLEQIDARTQVNGDEYAVAGSRDEDRFVVTGTEGRQELPACIMTFAYWDPAFLDQDRLLNSQTGDYLEVEVSPPQVDEVQVRGVMVPARRYELQAGELNIRLWYSPDDQWLALESDARGGRLLRYELL